MKQSTKLRQGTRRERTARYLEAHPDADPARLYVAAANAGVPLSLVAAAGGVSRFSLYLWVAGDVEPRPAQVTIIRRLTDALIKAVRQGDLPMFGAQTSDPEEKIEIIRRYL